MIDIRSHLVPGLRSRIGHRLLHIYFLLTRSMTLGIRVACFDESGRVFLVRHSYLPGWYLPGGGVERSETIEQAMEKEMREEGNLVALSKPKFESVFFNRAVSKRDHVLFYSVTVRQTAPRLPDWEIVESGFFALDALPPDTAKATLRRLAEMRGEVEPSPYW